MKKIIILIVLSMFFIGCGTQVMNLPTPEISSNSKIVGHCSNADGGFMLFDCIPIYANGRLERAYNKCMNSVGADSLTNISVVDRWFWTPLGNGHISIVEADGVVENKDAKK